MFMFILLWQAWGGGGGGGKGGEEELMMMSMNPRMKKSRQYSLVCFGLVERQR